MGLDVSRPSPGPTAHAVGWRLPSLQDCAAGIGGRTMILKRKCAKPQRQSWDRVVTGEKSPVWAKGISHGVSREDKSGLRGMSPTGATRGFSWRLDAQCERG